MRIDRKLNLIVPITRDDGSTLHVHSTPLTREVFEQFADVLARTLEMTLVKIGPVFGPRTAAITLRKVAREMDREGEVDGALMAEVRRLTNVVMPGDGGWTTMPYQDAIDRKMLSPDDVGEVENALIFFIAASSILPPSERNAAITGAAKLWDGETSSLNCTGFAASLPRLTPDANIGETPPAKKPSSLPS